MPPLPTLPPPPPPPVAQQQDLAGARLRAPAHSTTTHWVTASPQITARSSRSGAQQRMRRIFGASKGPKPPAPTMDEAVDKLNTRGDG